MQIKIAIPEDHTVELCYVVDLLFGDILNVDYTCETRLAITDVIIQVGEKKLIFQDHFFSKILDGENYLDEKYFPPKVRNLEYADRLVPILYGHDYFYRDERMTVCGLDLFSSLFFLLTAWEEDARKYIIKEHRYFPFNATWVWKNGLHDRDVLKEYVDLLVSLLIEIGAENEDLNYHFPKPSLYVFVQDLQYFNGSKKGPDWSDFFLSPKAYLEEKKKWKQFQEDKKDPLDNLHLWWSFAKENDYHMRLIMDQQLPENQKEKVKDFAKRKEIALGAGFVAEQDLSAYQNYDPVLIDEDFYTLQEKWSLLNQAGIKNSLNGCFFNFFGFRTAISIPFKVFDVKERKVMDLVEYPVVSSHFFSQNLKEMNKLVHKDSAFSNAANQPFLISNVLFEG